MLYRAPGGRPRLRLARIKCLNWFTINMVQIIHHFMTFDIALVTFSFLSEAISRGQTEITHTYLLQSSFLPTSPPQLLHRTRVSVTRFLYCCIHQFLSYWIRGVAGRVENPNTPQQPLSGKDSQTNMKGERW